MNPTLYAFAFACAPGSTRSLVQSLNLVAMGAVPNALAAGLQVVFADWQPADLNDGALENFYFLVMGVIALGVPVFLWLYFAYYEDLELVALGLPPRRRFSSSRNVRESIVPSLGSGEMLSAGRNAAEETPMTPLCEGSALVDVEIAVAGGSAGRDVVAGAENLAGGGRVSGRVSGVCSVSGDAGRVSGASRPSAASAASERSRYSFGRFSIGADWQANQPFRASLLGSMVGAGAAPSPGREGRALLVGAPAPRGSCPPALG